MKYDLFVAANTYKMCIASDFISNSLDIVKYNLSRRISSCANRIHFATYISLDYLKLIVGLGCG